VTDRLATTLVDTGDLHQRIGWLDSRRHRRNDSGRALSALEELAEVRTREQVAFGSTVIRTAGSIAIATTNARAIEQLATVHHVLEARVTAAIETVGAAEDKAIISSSEIANQELEKYQALVAAGRLTPQDAKYALARSNERHAFRMGRAAVRADRLAESFHAAAAEAVRRSNGGAHGQG
jgi:hypothetical protein